MWVSEIRRLLHLQFAKLKSEWSHDLCVMFMITGLVSTVQKEKATFTPPSQKKGKTSHTHTHTVNH